MIQGMDTILTSPMETGKATRINRSSGRTAAREIRRRQLIEAAIESIAKYGISGTTMSTVTGFAGLSVGTVNFHFESKEKLFEETLRFLAEEHRDQWQQGTRKAGTSLRDRLLAIVDAEFHPRICSRKKLTVWTAFYGEAGYRASYRKIMSDIDTERWGASRQICEAIIRDGNYSGQDGREIAETLEGLFDGFCLTILIYPGQLSAADAKLRVRAYLATVFPGYFDMPVRTCAKG